MGGMSLSFVKQVATVATIKNICNQIACYKIVTESDRDRLLLVGVGGIVAGVALLIVNCSRRKSIFGICSVICALLIAINNQPLTINMKSHSFMGGMSLTSPPFTRFYYLLEQR